MTPDQFDTIKVFSMIIVFDLTMIFFILVGILSNTDRKDK